MDLHRFRAGMAGSTRRIVLLSVLLLAGLQAAVIGAQEQRLLPGSAEFQRRVDRQLHWDRISELKSAQQTQALQPAFDELIEFELRHEPVDVLAAAEALAGLGEYHEAFGEFPEARAVRERIVKLLEERYGPRHWRTTDAKLELDHVERLDKLSREELAEWRAASVALAGGGPGSSDAAWEDDWFEREQHKQRQASDTIRRLLGTRDAQYLRALSQQAATVAAFSWDDRAEADRAYRELIEVLAAALGEQHPRLAAAYVAWSEVLSEGDEWFDDDVDASERRATRRRLEPLLLKASQLVRNLPPGSEPGTIQELVRLYERIERLSAQDRQQGDYSSAWRVLREGAVAELASVFFGPGDWRVTESQWNLYEASRLAAMTGNRAAQRDQDMQAWGRAESLAREGKLAEALAALERSAALHRQLFPDDHRYSGDYLHQKGVWLAGLAVPEPLFEEAWDEMFEEAWDEIERHSGKTRIDVAPVAGSDAAEPANGQPWTSAARQKLAEARKVLAEAFELRMQRLRGMHPSTQETARFLAALDEAVARDAVRRDDFSAAVAALDARVLTLSRVHGPLHWRVFDARRDVRAVLVRKSLAPPSRASVGASMGLSCR